jgi:endonuclease/exonuclease/phosphatase family metal-dependent hydrolase
MQHKPLLEKLDWVFTSSSWALSYLDTTVQVLSRPMSDHSPFVISIGTHVPKSKLFRFENF